MPRIKRLFPLTVLWVVGIASFLHSTRTCAQGCTSDFTLNPVTGNNRIEWEKFPEFSLPFPVIYNGPRFGDTQSRPLKHGFSHIAYFSGNEGSTLPVQNRALLWNSVASISGSNQPWSVVGLESPWGNDTSTYYRHWDRLIGDMANLFDDSRGSGVPKADLICLDIERVQELDRDILALKRDERVPAGYRALPDDVFLKTYKKDIQWWYAEAIRYLKKKGLSPATKVSSYSDVPVRGTWLNIPSNSWQDWKTNPQRTHFLAQNLATGQIGGPFYDQLNVLTPSAYYFYPYENPLGKDYLTYLLFQIEVNKAWSPKEVIPFVWLRYHTSFSPDAPLIPKHLAEATAIFPVFSGATGMWLWDSNSYERTEQQNYATYEYFIHGLYRLSQFGDMFQGNYELVIPTSARDLMEQRSPVWRGVVKGSQILIAAQNPYATESEATELRVGYKSWSKTITLKGREVFLCKFNVNEVLSALEISLLSAKVYPNPANQHVQLLLTSQTAQDDIIFELYDLKGSLLKTTKNAALNGTSTYKFDLPTLPRGSYLIKIRTGHTSISRHVFVE